jgi:hypothetical protein
MGLFQKSFFGLCEEFTEPVCHTSGMQAPWQAYFAGKQSFNYELKLRSLLPLRGIVMTILLLKQSLIKINRYMNKCPGGF